MIDLRGILDTELADATGRTARIRDRVADKPAVLVFVRHFA